MTGYLIVNPYSGDQADVGELCAAAEARGVVAHVLGPGEDATELARAADADAIGMAGGDGSLGPVAAVCIERQLPFVCVPFGTRNHFARDLGLDRSDPVGALEAFASGEERTIDVAFANDRVFLNNISLGAYAQLVHRREYRRRRRELLARLRALASSIRHWRAVGFSVDGEPVQARIVLVANNAYSLTVLSLGARERLDEGLLYLYVTAGLLRPAWRDRSAPHFAVEARARRMRAAVDGEPATFETPIEFRIEPGALRVLVPGGPPA
jgi:diacylglycerol kinase family enzyme